MCTAILPLSAYGHDCLSLYICHYHSCIRTKCPAMCSLWRARPSPIPEALQLKAMTPHRYHWRRQFQWQILDIFKPLHSMISLPEWSHFWINDSDENQSMSKVYHDQSGISSVWLQQKGRAQEGNSGSVARVGGIHAFVASKLATMFFRWHLGCTKDDPVEEGR